MNRENAGVKMKRETETKKNPKVYIHLANGKNVTTTQLISID